jgi:hypothetical protein
VELNVQWYLNDASLQAQFLDRAEFEIVLRTLVSARARVPVIRQNLRSTRSLLEAMVAPDVTMRRAIMETHDRDTKSAVFSWLDKNGPFVDDDRLHEVDDYFEFNGVDVTATGLGEAARRTKGNHACASFSFVGGVVNYATNPLGVDHGLREDRYGRYDVVNVWKADALVSQAIDAGEPVKTWGGLVEYARQRFVNLEIGALHSNPALAREPFEASLRDRALELMGILDAYVQGRNADGSEGPAARHLIETYFTGDRALFSGESPQNQRQFNQEMTFNRTTGDACFAQWHGKISHRYFRLHFEWPLEKEREKIEIFYLGPKITKS